MTAHGGLAAVFDRCRSERRAALVAYLMAGDPTLERTPALVRAAVRGGADIIELGIPYSDPLADGPTIQAAAQRALQAGATLERVLETAASLTGSGVDAPMIAFTYYNPLLARGLRRSAEGLSAAGFSSAIIPDLPPEEAAGAREAFAASGVGLTFLVAPTTPPERVRSIADASTDFVYAVSRMGVTGASASLDGIKPAIAAMRRATEKPVAVGFGISSPAQAADIAAVADGIVVGSSLIDRMRAAPEGEQEAAVRDYCASLAAAVRGDARLRI